ncbi:7-carboxy-7-deazaguanine synthase QueE [Actinomycetospora flava]|uniref:7-carboxy-7-deazaguanine synthase QueE n=1 Tax=Actinomycetospora flava TaxID=3129232 RepID=UPI0035A04DAB
MTSTTLWVSELFGPTVQGEGASTGRPAMFLRTGHCPLRCSWCDTRYTWDWSLYSHKVEVRPMDVHEVWSALSAAGAELPTPLLVVTGGEPLLQREALLIVVESARREGWRVEVETSGVIEPGCLVGKVDLFTVSPKLANSGMPARRRLKISTLREFVGLTDHVFKFVVRHPSELEEVEAIVADVSPKSVVIQPEATDNVSLAERSRILVEPVIRRGWTLGTRLHITLWGDERGR